MASLKQFRNRIASVKSTRKITKAMQLVAASKLRRAQDAAEAARPYAERMERVLANLGGAFKTDESAPILMRGTGRDDTHLVIVATADRGLCGAFNTNIVKLARARIEALLAQKKTVKIFCVGRKGRDQLRRTHQRLIVETVDFMGLKRVGFPEAQAISRRVLEMFEAGEFDVATLFYAQFRNVISQVPTAQQIIPAALPAGAAAQDATKGAAYIYEPDEQEILTELLPRNITVQVFKALLENAASEQGARMSAMDNATRNAGEVIGKLTLEMNRTRQAQITKELIEIISGADAV